MQQNQATQRSYTSENKNDTFERPSRSSNNENIFIATSNDKKIDKKRVENAISM